MTYIVGGIITLLVLFSLTPAVFDQYEVLTDEDGVETGVSYFDIAPGGVEAAIGAVLTVFFVLVLWNMYKNA